MFSKWCGNSHNSLPTVSHHCFPSPQQKSPNSDSPAFAIPTPTKDSLWWAASIWNHPPKSGGPLMFAIPTLNHPLPTQILYGKKETATINLNHFFWITCTKLVFLYACSPCDHTVLTTAAPAIGVATAAASNAAASIYQHIYIFVCP